MNLLEAGLRLSEDLRPRSFGFFDFPSRISQSAGERFTGEVDK